MTINGNTLSHKCFFFIEKCAFKCAWNLHCATISLQLTHNVSLKTKVAEYIWNKKDKTQHVSIINVC